MMLTNCIISFLHIPSCNVNGAIFCCFSSCSFSFSPKNWSHNININGKIIIVKLVCDIALRLLLFSASITRAHKYLSSNCKFKRLNDGQSESERERERESGTAKKTFRIESNRHSNDFNPIHRSCVIRIFITTFTSRCRSTRICDTAMYISFSLLLCFFPISSTHQKKAIVTTSVAMTNCETVSIHPTKQRQN